MKKYAAALSISAVLLLGACSGSEESNPGSVNDGEETPGSGAIDHGVDENKVGFSMSGDEVEEAENVPEAERDNILAAFDRYIDTLNQKDLDGYLETLSAEGYDLDEERKVMEDMFERYDLKREADNETIVKFKEDEAQLFSTMKTTITEIASGASEMPEGRQVTVFHKEDGAWKVYSIHFIGDEPANK